MGGEWTRVAVGDLLRDGVLEIGDGYRARNAELSAHGLPFARAGNLKRGFDFSEADRVPPATLRHVGRKQSCPGDVVFTSKGTVGRFAYVTGETEPFVFSPQLCFWRSQSAERLDSRFLFFWFHSRECAEQLEVLKGQTDMADYISLRDQRTMVIALPPIADQRAIASVLGALDDKIESNRRLVRHARDVLTAAFERIGSEAVDMTTLGSLGQVVGGGTPKSSQPSYWEPADVPWITPKDITALAGVPVIGRGSRAISQDGLRRSSAKLLPTGSVVYTSRATLGLVAITQQPLATNQGFISLVPHQRFGSAFVYAALVACREAINAEANGSTFLEVNKTNFKVVQCPRPSDEAIAGFRAVADPLIATVSSVLREARTLAALRDVLLPKLVSGQVRVR